MSGSAPALEAVAPWASRLTRKRRRGRVTRLPIKPGPAPDRKTTISDRRNPISATLSALNNALIQFAPRELLGQIATPPRRGRQRGAGAGWTAGEETVSVLITATHRTGLYQFNQTSHFGAHYTLKSDVASPHESGFI